MKKHNNAIGVALLVVAATVYYTHVMLPKQTVWSTNPRDTVHRIAAKDSLGSGTAIAAYGGKTLVVTAWHVVRDGGPYTVAGKPAKLVAVDKVWDLAALVVDDQMKSSAVSKQAPEYGTVMTVCGYGSGIYSENTGKVVGWAYPEREQIDDYKDGWLIIDARARSGDSGGPLFYADGTVGGVLWGSDNTGAHATPCVRVRRFLLTITGYDSLVKAALLGPSYDIW